MGDSASLVPKLELLIYSSNLSRKFNGGGGGGGEGPIEAQL